MISVIYGYRVLGFRNLESYKINVCWFVTYEYTLPLTKYILYLPLNSVAWNLECNYTIVALHLYKVAIRRRSIVPQPVTPTIASYSEYLYVCVYVNIIHILFRVRFFAHVSVTWNCGFIFSEYNCIISRWWRDDDDGQLGKGEFMYCGATQRRNTLKPTTSIILLVGCVYVLIHIVADNIPTHTLSASVVATNVSNVLCSCSCARFDAVNNV